MHPDPADASADAPSGIDDQALLHRGFLDARAHLLEVAALMDRLDRAAGSAAPDPRRTALPHLLRLVADTPTDRTATLLDALSDPGEGPRPDLPEHPVTGLHPDAQISPESPDPMPSA